MNANEQFLLVNANALPDVFLKVLDAKIYLAQGKAENASQAAKMAGISRSAYYKYKDAVFTADQGGNDAISTLSVTLKDEAGVLSRLINKLYDNGANIITINQNIPVDSVAHVSISIRTRNITKSMEDFLKDIKELNGVVHLKVIAAQ
ncbi:MAG: ACT domain-containing protein [Oscillospiraceae bacterium]|nr:ACT domain-containing protein [Oscillospiraceae bacterium]